MSLPDADARVRAAAAAIGAGPEFSGFCERFVRTCFGFPARYATARLAWQATGRRHTDTSPPAGVPVFWDILSGPNVHADHIALSTGGGFCISTSAGPGRTVAKVSITDLTRRWGMQYRGWSEDYHGVIVHQGGRGGEEGSEVTDSSAGPWPQQDLPVTRRHTASSLGAWRILMTRIGFDDDDLDLALQRWLRKLGHYSDEFRLDGEFLTESIKAMQSFLRVKGLYLFDIDGDRGPDTIKAEIRYLNQQRRFL